MGRQPFELCVFSGDLPLHDIYLQFNVKVWQNKLMMMILLPLLLLLLLLLAVSASGEVSVFCWWQMQFLVLRCCHTVLTATYVPMTMVSVLMDFASVAPATISTKHDAVH